MFCEKEVDSLSCESAWANYFTMMVDKDDFLKSSTLEMIRLKLVEYGFNLEPVMKLQVAKKDELVPLIRKMKNNLLRAVSELFYLDANMADFEKKFESKKEITKAFYEEFNRRNMDITSEGTHLYYYNEWKKNQWFAVKMMLIILLFVTIGVIVILR